MNPRLFRRHSPNSMLVKVQSRGSFTLLLLAILILPHLSCSGSTSSSSNQSGVSPLVLQEAIDAFVAENALPTYNALVLACGDLEQAVIDFDAAPDQSTLDWARHSWRETRIPWEGTEAFGLGPFATNGYDPAMDTWPPDLVELDEILNDVTPLTAAYMHAQQPGVKGFHGIEFVLFGEANDKDLGDFTARDVEYLLATTEDLCNVAQELEASWTVGINGQPPFAETFSTAGTGSPLYALRRDALLEVAMAVVGSLEEVGEEKLGGPLATLDPAFIESYFSFNTLADVTSNVEGAQHLYDSCLSILVLDQSPLLDTVIRNQIQAALDSIALIPPPFEITVFQPGQAELIEGVIQNISAAGHALEHGVLPLLVY